MLLPIGDDDSSQRTAPFFTYALIAANVLVFLLELSGGDAFVLRWAFIPSRFLANPVSQFPTIFTSMFMHAGWLHIGGNMLYLWIFGDNVEDRFGHVKFVIFYLLCGVAAILAQLAFSIGSDVPTLGASGAISGVLAAYVVMFPMGRVRVLLGLLPLWMPAWIVIGLWIALQFLIGFGTVTSAAQTGGIAYMAHFGGFLAGLLLTFFFRRSRGVRARP